MSESRTPQDPSYQLFRLPKEKVVLDFVLQKLCEGGSPDRYEMVDSLLTMYRTSAGFDPFALTKGRFKRMKAAEFKQHLLEIDREIGSLINSDDYRHHLAQQSGFDPLFKEYSELSKGVILHPAMSLTSELEHFEKACSSLEAEELLLTFYRKHTGFLEELYRQQGPDEFLSRYDQALERQRQLQRQFRLGFELIRMEQAGDKGIFDESKSLALLQELGVLLTLEKNKQHRYSLLLFIARTCLLTATPGRNLSPYLHFLAEYADQLLLHRPEAQRFVYSILAQYKIDAGRDQRIHWLEMAEAEVKELELHDERPGLRFIRCMIETDAGRIEEALRSLNEAEHLIYKASNRSLAARNNWVRLSEFRTLLFTLQALEGDATRIEQMTLLQQLAEDMGRHRQEIAVMLLEWRGLQSFLQKDYSEAFGFFDRAKGYRKNGEEHPWYQLDKFFCLLLGKSKKKNSLAEIALQTEQLCEPFYSKVIGSIFKLAESTAILTEENKKLQTRTEE